MNKIPDGTDVLGKPFGIRQCLSNDTATALAKGIVDQARFTTGLTRIVDRLAFLLPSTFRPSILHYYLYRTTKMSHLPVVNAA
jgi:hypothetical protein